MSYILQSKFLTGQLIIIAIAKHALLHRWPEKSKMFRNLWLKKDKQLENQKCHLGHK